MPLTKPIPKEARSIVRRIRKDVPRPELNKILSQWTQGRGLRIKYSGRCPMGLLPYTKCKIPLSPCDFEDSRISYDAIIEFASWWDLQTDATAAVDAVWGKR